MAMRTFEQWAKDERGLDLPGNTIPGSWFVEHNIPMVVACTCCEMTMCVVSALIDDDGQCYCGSCSEFSDTGYEGIRAAIEEEGEVDTEDDF